MNKMIEDYCNAFIKNNFTEKVYLTKEEYDVLESKENVLYDKKTSTYYRNVTNDVSNEDLNMYLSLRMVNYTNKMEQNYKTIISKIDVIETVVIFWVVLTCIGLVGALLAIAKVI